MLIYNELWDLANRFPGSFEFKEMVIFQAGKAIKEQDVSCLYGAFSTFNPNYPEEGTTEYSSEMVNQFVKKSGIEKFVKERIVSK